LHWNPQGTRKRGRPKKTWRRLIMEEAQREGRTWREVKRLAADRSRWKSFVEALCFYTGSDDDDESTDKSTDDHDDNDDYD
jgi:hypothetical protein